MIFRGASRHHRITSILIGAFLAVMVNLSVIPTPAHSVTAEEQLSDPVLEDRARDLFLQLRCLVCQNQSIGDSDAELAIDLRKDVRKINRKFSVRITD